MTDRTSGRIQALYVGGTLTGLDDAELLGRFATGRGIEREDAFAALVRRHGSMVLSVCLRMLGGDRAGAEDAFQAVFLVLARKAGALRRPDRLRPWLYGVAVKAGKEARRRSSRIRAREGGTLVDGPAPEADADLFELRAAIDEELRRLPERYREPILLCELEGVSRRDAAKRLGLAEGTLSSRLARGKTLLRHGLARRGLVVGALAAALAPVRAAGLDALADSTVRLVLASPLAPVAAAAIAEGVLAMLAVAKLKALATASAAVLALLALSAGIAQGLPQDAPAPKTATRTDKPKPPPKRDETRFRGVVVDEDGRPIAGADVRLMPFTTEEVATRSGPNGSYVLTSPARSVGAHVIVARSDDGRRIGSVYHGYAPTPKTAEKPARIVARPAREALVRVVDAAGKPVAGASVEAASGFAAVANVTTDAVGEARIALPVDRRVQWIAARKSAVGCGYRTFGEYPDHHDGGARPEELPPLVTLALSDPRTVSIRVRDEADAPASGIRIRNVRLKIEGNRGELYNPSSRFWMEETGPDGVAVFDWLPIDAEGPLMFRPTVKEGYADRLVLVEPGQSEADAPLVRNVAIRGRVSLPDGSAARGAKVTYSPPYGRSGGLVWSVAADDGSYELANVPPDEGYAVWAEFPGWAVTPRTHVVVGRGGPTEGVDLHLARGTVVKGEVTVGPDNRPAAGMNVGVVQTGRAPTDPPNITRILWGGFRTKIDDRGRYEMRIGPGKYYLMPPYGGGSVEIEITDQPELVRDFHPPWPKRRKLAGRVVDQADRPVADAVLEFTTTDSSRLSASAATDADGRFVTEWESCPTLVLAKSADGSLGTALEIGPDDVEVALTLTPTATATGRLLDEKGEPARRTRLRWGRRAPSSSVPDPAGAVVFEPRAVTDDDGRFTLPALIVGQKYEIGVRPEADAHVPSLGFVRPERPGPIDLGTLRVQPEGRE